MSSSAIPHIGDIRSAQVRIAPYVVRTPLLEYPQLNARVGGRVLIKPEVLQRTGSFKPRGAFNRLLALSEEERRLGVVAFSSGNHAQAVAFAARTLGLAAIIVMPMDAPAVKRAATVNLGARVIDYDRVRDDREAIAREVSERTGAIVVPAFDDPAIIAGQGTAGAEIAEDCARLGIRPDQFLAPVSGGGLIAGCSLAIHADFPQTRCVTVEPEGFDDHRRSLLAGVRVQNAALSGSLCDALLAPMPGELTFAINSAHLSGALTVSDEDVLKAMSYAARELKLTVEPGGAVALAALLSGAAALKGETAVIMLSGGNADPQMLMRALAQSV
ncbi:MAG: threonine/serine dehydratase [Alphaproteobacteria bacterium]|nr:threonine/serine dehydratase [Alphaproteobacteria bacterium]